jgi:hypothetical protein
MFFLFGERVRLNQAPVGLKSCPVCRSEQAFTARRESLWFTFFGLPLLPMEEVANYWCCEHCLNAFEPGRVDAPSQVALVQRVIVYLLTGYGHQDQHSVANEISVKLTDVELSSGAFREISRDLQTMRLDMVEQVRAAASRLNSRGKQQVLQAAFLATYICCDLQYEDRLRINLIGNALGVGIEFVEYAIQETRRHNYYGVHRLSHREREV